MSFKSETITFLSGISSLREGEMFSFVTFNSYRGTPDMTDEKKNFIKIFLKGIIEDLKSDERPVHVANLMRASMRGLNNFLKTFQDDKEACEIVENFISEMKELLPKPVEQEKQTKLEEEPVKEVKANPGLTRHEMYQPLRTNHPNMYYVRCDGFHC